MGESYRTWRDAADRSLERSVARREPVSPVWLQALGLVFMLVVLAGTVFGVLLSAGVI